MRGLVTCRTVCSAGAVRWSKHERRHDRVSDLRLLNSLRGALLLALRLLDSRTPTVRSGRLVQSGITASDQHQPASSRATATLAITGRFLRRFKLTQRACSRWLPACPRAPGPRQVPDPSGAAVPRPGGRCSGGARRPRPAVAAGARYRSW